MFDESGPRRVVPRWRSSRVAATTPEAQANKPGVKQDFSRDVRETLAEFRDNPSVPVAAELMFLANQAGQVELAKEAAESILDREAKLSSAALVRTARSVISSGVGVDALPSHAVFVRNARRSLFQNYNNPILLVDLAHALTANGQAKSAEKFLRSALQLAPNSRFVLRSAVRYYLHIGQHELAHRLLLRSPLLAGDPWIQASEIAVSTVLGRTSKLVKSIDKALQATTTLALNFSELGSAVATVHLNSGGDKKAKKLFAKSLENPNDNTVAQAEWAARRLGLVVSEKALRVPLSFEANSAHSYRSIDIDNAISQGLHWMDDEPFSSRPIGWLGYLHSINGDFEQASEFQQKVIQLEATPSIGDLLNLNFSRIETGAIDEAALQLVEMSTADDIGSYRAHFFANAGALFYAIGDVERGAELYQRAMNSAKAKADAYTETLVKAFFARAAVKYGDSRRDLILDDAVKHSALNSSPGATLILRRLVDQSSREKLEASAKKKVAKQKVLWDPKSNTLTLN